ncbi:hypothetical protein ZWY2020_008197 [Hordeum vulgare]|nr:hypothetical protein ZWY2020_008197 [Hordeum vulgare]
MAQPRRGVDMEGGDCGHDEEPGRVEEEDAILEVAQNRQESLRLHEVEAQGSAPRPCPPPPTASLREHGDEEGDSSRSKITTVASKIMNNNNADATFKKLCLIYIVSTMLAPTTDTRISNKCYPMLLRYPDALDCDVMELELPDTPHTVNAWSKTQVDVVAEMDMLEHDPPSYGNFQGLTAPTTSNSTNSRINSGADTGESDDTLSEDSSSSESDDGTDEDDVDIEREKKKRNTREEHIDSGNAESPLMRKETESCDKTLSGDPSAQFDTKSPSGATSQLNLPSDSDVCSSGNNSPTHTLVNSQELEQKIIGSATGLANRLCELKSTRPADTERDSGSTHEEIKLVVAKELGLLKETCTQQFEERNAHKDLTKINGRPIKQMSRRKHAESTQEDGEKELEYVQQLGVSVAIKRKSTAKLKQPSPKRQATRRSPRLARISSSNATRADVSRARMEQSSSASSGNKVPGVETSPQMFEYPMSEKLTAFLATGDQDEMDADLVEELDDYESHLVDFFKKKRAAEATPAAARSNDMTGEAGVQSVTPKPNPHKGRVKKPSRFQLSPYDDEIKVSNEEEDVVIIIKYEKRWVYTWDLADSSYITGELSLIVPKMG